MHAVAPTHRHARAPNGWLDASVATASSQRCVLRNRAFMRAVGCMENKYGGIETHSCSAPWRAVYYRHCATRPKYTRDVYLYNDVEFIRVHQEMHVVAPMPLGTRASNSRRTVPLLRSRLHSYMHLTRALHRELSSVQWHAGAPRHMRALPPDSRQHATVKNYECHALVNRI